MNSSQPISIYYETKFPYYAVTASPTVCLLMGYFLTGGGYLDNIFFYLLCVSSVAFLFVCVYQGSKFYIYEDKIVWEKGCYKMESTWDEFVGIHYDAAPNMWYSTRGFKSNNFFLETKLGFTKYADEWNIRRKGESTFRSKSKELIEEIKKYSGKDEDVGAVSAFHQRQNLWGVVLLLLAIFIVPLIIIILYSFFTKDLGLLSTFSDIFSPN